VANVAVIIVNYNSGAFLKQCLVSLRRSTIPLEIVVVDNGSSDGSADCISKVNDVSDVQVIRNITNLGFAVAVNQGAESTTAEDVLLINPDCIVQPHSVAGLKLAMQREECGAVGGLVFGFDGREQAGCRRRDPTFPRSVVKLLGKLGVRFGLMGVDLTMESLPKNPIQVDAVSGAFMMIHRESFEAIGGMDEGYFLHFEDLDLCRRLRNAGMPVLFVPSVSVLHCQGISSRKRPFRVEWHKHLGMCRYRLKFSQASRISHWLFRLFVGIHLIWRVCCLVLEGQWKSKMPASGRGVSALTTTSSGTVVLGGHNDVAEYLVPRLSGLARTVLVLSRSGERKLFYRSAAVLHPEYLDKVPDDDLPLLEDVICTMPIWHISKYEGALRRCGVRRLVAFSSTSITTKSDSMDQKEKDVARRLQEGERWLESFCRSNDVACLIVRPTIIYGGHYNRSIRLVQKMIRILGVFPFVIPERGTRQPIHADDLAQMAVAWINSTVTGVEIVSVAGRNVLSNRLLMERLFRSVGRKLRVLPVRARYVQILLQCGSRVFRGLLPSPAAIDRLAVDLGQSNDEAIEKFDFRPSPNYA
jgi:GT2 family glycosyltransferase